MSAEFAGVVVSPLPERTSRDRDRADTMSQAERDELLYEARRLRLQHNNQFYGPMKDATCGCEVCKWLVVFIEAERRALQAEAVVKAAQAFHKVFWNPWRSGSKAMTGDAVTEAYGELRRALSAVASPGKNQP